MLAYRLRRWANIKPTLVQCVVFAGIGLEHGKSKQNVTYVFIHQAADQPLSGFPREHKALNQSCFNLGLGSFESMYCAYWGVIMCFCLWMVTMVT